MFKMKPEAGDLLLDLDGDTLLVAEVKNFKDEAPPANVTLTGQDWWVTLQCISGENSGNIFYDDNEGFASGYYHKVG